MYNLKEEILFHSLDTIHTINRNDNNNNLEIKNVIKYAETLRHVSFVKNEEDLIYILNAIYSRKICLNKELELEEKFNKLYYEHINNNFF